MDVADTQNNRPEDLLDELARGEDNLGERLLRMARAASALDRASILDLLTDDAELPAPIAAPAPAMTGVSGATESDLNRPQKASPTFARLHDDGGREEGSTREYDIQVAPTGRRMEAAR